MNNNPSRMRVALRCIEVELENKKPSIKAIRKIVAGAIEGYAQPSLATDGTGATSDYSTTTRINNKKSRSNKYGLCKHGCSRNYCPNPYCKNYHIPNLDFQWDIS